MKVIKTKPEMQAVSEKIKKDGKSIGLVPTMGYLHDGHVSLIKRSKKDCDYTVLTVFVNPTQFGPDEDFNKYPRDFNRDSKIAENEGVDYIFNPDTGEMYSENHSTYVNVEKLDKIMCGKFRPVHFKGVCTIVLKLFNIINPDAVFFGKKDYQQLAIIKKMVEDLDVCVEIAGCETVREPDGLALSSRNKYLTKEERENAIILYKTILFAENEIKNSRKNLPEIKKECIEKLSSNKFVKKIDYFDLRDPENLKEIKKIKSGTNSMLIASAVYIGETRLIDNKVVLL
ncbi:MAG: pantoate--beta-alanine ligase [Actinobacteria bacterium]|nr:pantoate--beta-alanine ligase [Actinomycetota bacterium]